MSRISCFINLGDAKDSKNYHFGQNMLARSTSEISNFLF